MLTFVAKKSALHVASYGFIERRSVHTVDTQFTPMHRKNLVILRAGDESLHSRWLEGERNWDLCISSYTEKYRGTREAEYNHHKVGGKWSVIYEVLNSGLFDLDDYDFFWLPDDDIDTGTDSINRLFDLAAEFGMDLCQPALTYDSYYTYPITLKHPFFDYRHTNFVEIMVPVLSTKMLKSCAELFENTESGFCIDWEWHKRASSPSAVGILDCVSVRHTRELKSHLRRNMQKAGIDAEKEKQQLIELHGVVREPAVVTGGKLRDLYANHKHRSILGFVIKGYIDVRRMVRANGKLRNKKLSYWKILKNSVNQYLYLRKKGEISAG